MVTAIRFAADHLDSLVSASHLSSTGSHGSTKDACTIQMHDPDVSRECKGLVHPQALLPMPSRTFVLDETPSLASGGMGIVGGETAVARTH